MTKKNDAAAEAGKDAADKVMAGLADDTTGGEQGELIERDNRTVIDGGADQLMKIDEAIGLPFNRLPGADSLGVVSFEPTHAEKTAALIARIDAHEAEGAAIEAVMTELGHDAKSIRTIKRARAKAEAAKRTYDALFGAGLVKEGQV